MDLFDLALYRALNKGGGGGDITVEPLTVTANGQYAAPSGTAYSPVNVEVSGGGSTYAFVRAYFLPGSTVIATDGTTTLTSDTSGDYWFAIPNAGTWTFTSNGYSVQSTPEYASSTDISVVNVHSLVPVLSADDGHVIYNNNVNYYWASKGDCWKAFNGDIINYGQYWGENQSGVYVGYQFESPVFISNVVWYGSNYSTGDYYLIDVECLINGTWVKVASFIQEKKDTTPITTIVNKTTEAIRLVSPTTKTGGNNLFIREITINGVEL